MRAPVIAFATAMAILSPPLVNAQAPDEPAATTESATDDPADERAAQFVGVTGAETERIPGGTLMLAAYAIVWILLFGYLFRMRMMQRQTADELRRLGAEIKAPGGS
ncbi:MAG: CcmD family protein [Myxococcota bacterium]